MCRVQVNKVFHQDKRVWATMIIIAILLGLTYVMPNPPHQWEIKECSLQ